MQKYLLDTNSLIYALNGGVKIPAYEYVVSVITEIELLSYSKLTQKEEENIKHLLTHFQIVTLTDNIKNTTIYLRKRYNLKLPDSIIVATAIEKGAVLVTSDKQLLKLDCLKVVELADVKNKNHVQYH